jgi:ABC-type transport system involved in multi-copper enzyme maturation permease subunit
MMFHNPMIMNHLFHILQLIRNELKRLFLPWLAPLPIFIGTVWYSSKLEWEPVSLNSTGTWLYILAGIILIMVYGLQSFSSEADRKTLDFILTKPISQYSIIFAKYFTGLFIFWCWWRIFAFFFRPNLSLLNLPQGIGNEWLILLLLTVHAVSLFSGLLARGLERFFVISVMTLTVGSMSYYLWNKIFTLVNTNFLWFDIPPRLLSFLEKILPCYLAFLSLLVPFTGVVWILKSKTRLWRFKPALGLVGIWSLSFGTVIIAYYLFSPQVWPDRTARFGDWSPGDDIVLVGFNETANSQTNAHQWYLSINRLGRKPHLIYTGNDLKNPRFAPNGNFLVFSEKGRLHIYNPAKKSVSDIGEGDLATWDNTGEKLIAAKQIGDQGLSRLYLIDLIDNQTQELTSDPIKVTDLLWDSDTNQLYIWDFTNRLTRMDLKNKTIKELRFPEKEQPLFFGVVKPNIRFQKEDRLIFIGQVFDRTVKVWVLNIKNETIWLSEEKSDFRILTNGPLLINPEGTAYLWPRIDGGFVYQSTYYDRNHTHEHDQECKHAHDHW